ncbi:hypothetical protein DOTSEDRAFT_73514 [Dothistroma septosporum NZE10]|uniref:Uncharacterized protein n=1 Tax=Dothistroma septosporum (strain NZE10 / CBS 128990) TaxID=675120 RepID=N1PMJ5_DOTSN|nr:hypothetical protein DOTSEDRAFT_73514 [Dothistroma septosporum NZE10]
MLSLIDRTTLQICTDFKRTWYCATAPRTGRRYGYIRHDSKQLCEPRQSVDYILSATLNPPARTVNLPSCPPVYPHHYYAPLESPLSSAEYIAYNMIRE